MRDDRALGQRLCERSALLLVGARARQEAPPVVPASAIGAWHWCRLKAWHNTSLFNTGWLSLDSLSQEELEGLLYLWVSELWKRGRERIITGRLIHGDSLDEAIGEAVTGPRLAETLLRGGVETLIELIEKGVLDKGLIRPEEYEEQLRRYLGASDIVEYFRREDWPMIARRPRGEDFMVIGVPDDISYGRGGLRVVELKTSSKPWLVKKHSRGYLAAKTQLATYAWILVDKWPVEEAILVYKDVTGRTFLRERFAPEDLAEWFEAEILPSIVARLASEEPPEPSERPPCKTCEYGIEA